ncbi:MAG: hypothetical protein ABS79_01110 [Planctomycetes bacterium SCN 63-9]|nr:MAG: hypothetical protein ABS79_01110 [Planctomycetes bacterium SCN 63-9]
MPTPEPKSGLDAPLGVHPDPNPFAAPAQRSPIDRIGGLLKAHERGLLVLAAIAQLLFLAAMAIPGAKTLMTGETILLRVVPVDPRDLFRGDYVILSYDISRVPSEGIAGMPAPSRWAEDQADEWRGRTIYVALEPEEDGRHYRGVSASVEPPTSGKFIKGKLESPFRIEYGIESYYVQEGSGKAYEEAIRSRKLSAAIALAPDGSSTLRELIIEDDGNAR